MQWGPSRLTIDGTGPEETADRCAIESPAGPCVSLLGLPRQRATPWET